jgi:tetratricopeptide (TPR) repeat protein
MATRPAAPSIAGSNWCGADGGINGAGNERGQVKFSPIFAGLAGLVLLFAPGLATAKQLAVVVGNDVYAEVTPLTAGVNDARAMTDRLQRVGFEVELVENGTKRQMSRAFSKIEAKVEPGDTVVFHYSGHGFEIDGQNWLLPIDVPAAREGEAGLVKDEAFNAAEVIDRFRGKGAGRVIAILDACRNNPFAKPGTRALSGGRGLARMDAAGGVFIMFSAGAKQEALDKLTPSDPEKTSIFVRSFLPLIERKDMTLIDMAKEAQERVRTLALSVGHEQIPAYYDGIVGRVTLTGAPTVSPVVKTDVTAARPEGDAAADSVPAKPAAVASRPIEVAPEVTSPEIEACDRAAAAPRDPDKPANIPGIDYEALAAQSGILACRKAAEIPGAPRRILFQLGRSYAKLGNKRDGVLNYIKATELKHPIAMYNLGVLHLKGGDGVKQDYGLARVMFESAASAGVDEALNQVGSLYENGQGGPRDYKKALFYYRRAIELGNASATSSLGAMYLFGHGVAKDGRKACELFGQSATLGNAAGTANVRKFCRG